MLLPKPVCYFLNAHLQSQVLDLLALLVPPLLLASSINSCVRISALLRLYEGSSKALFMERPLNGAKEDLPSIEL